LNPTGELPFSVKPLVGEIPAGAEDHVNYEMELNPDTIPSGAVVITPAS
jgi:hypothetical protein